MNPFNHSLALTKALQGEIEKAIKLEDEREQQEIDSPQWVALGDELRGVYNEIAWSVVYAHRYPR